MFVFWGNVHNIINLQAISNNNINAMTYDLEAICHKTSFLWANLPIGIKFATSLSGFKTKIKSSKHNSCVCQQELGFL